MQIGNTPSPAATIGAREPDEAPLEGARNTLSADFDTFLRLLTTQMRNQDPLNPMESTEFVAQLAQFSTVEQQIVANRTLTSILEAVTEAGTGSMAGWLGREVRAEVPATFNGDPVEVFPSPPEITAASAVLVVRDADGGIVAEQPFSPGEGAVRWNGTMANGATAPAGRYSFSARYATAQGETETAPAATYGRVTEARMDGGALTLVLASGATVKADDVTGIRAPNAL